MILLQTYKFILTFLSFKFSKLCNKCLRNKLKLICTISCSRMCNSRWGRSVFFCCFLQILFCCCCSRLCTKGHGSLAGKSTTEVFRRCLHLIQRFDLSLCIYRLMLFISGLTCFGEIYVSWVVFLRNPGLTWSVVRIPQFELAVRHGGTTRVWLRQTWVWWSANALMALLCHRRLALWVSLLISASECV